MTEQTMLGETQTVTDETTPVNDGAAPVSHPVYGDLAVKWPEGMAEGMDLEPSLKSFVDKESGEVNFANMIKSYVHGQKSIGSDKIIVPTENSTAEEWDSIHEQLFNFKIDPNEYKVDRTEDAKIPEQFYEDFKKVAHENRIPMDKAQKLMSFYEEKVGVNIAASQTQSSEKMEADIKGLRDDWGEAFGKNLNSAKKVIEDYGSDDIKGYLEESGLGNDTKLIRFLSDIGQKLYAEDSFVQNSSSVGAKTPAEAEARIGEIMANPIYFNPNHPENAALKKEISKMYEYKNAGK